MNMTSFLKTIAMAGSFAVLSAVSAQALSCSASSGPQTVNYELEQLSPDAALDKACVSNANDTNTINSTYSIFSQTGWILAAKTDGTGGNGNITFGTKPTAGDATGAWSLNNPNGYTEIFITLVQGNSFAAFLLDTTKTLAGGFWATSGPGGSVQGLSHSSVYYRGTGTPPSTIPVPAAGLLLVGALGGLLASKRRRKTA